MSSPPQHRWSWARPAKAARWCWCAAFPMRKPRAAAPTWCGRSRSISSGSCTMILALAGGVGGAKLAGGLQRALGRDLTLVVNTGDDFHHMGLVISPDLDTVMYTLAGINNRETGWGIAG